MAFDGLERELRTLADQAEALTLGLDAAANGIAMAIHPASSRAE